MAPAWAHESLRSLHTHQIEFDDFNICRLMAEKAMHNQDYTAQLERSAYGRDNPAGLSELNVEIEKSMAVLRQKYIEAEAWRKFRRRAFKVDDLNMLPSRQTASMKWKSATAALRENRAPRARAGPEWICSGTASSNARRALTLLAANQRIQADPHPFQLMRLPTELREQAYRELLIGGGRTVVVCTESVLSVWSRSCNIEGPSAYGKDITTALLRSNRQIYDEALPILYQSHAFDFGIDVHNIAPFFSRTSSAARQNVGCIHMELLRYGIDRPLRSVPGRDDNDNCLDWSRACAYIAGNLRISELSFNINFTIHQDFQRFRWVKDLAQIRSVRKGFHHDSPNKHGLKSSEASVVLANQMSRQDWGTDEYRWEALLAYLSPKMLH